MLKRYPAIFHEAEEGGYWVNFPDFGGSTEGDTLDEAFEMAQDCLSSLLAHYIEEGLDIPKPTDLKNLKLDEKSFGNYLLINPEPYLIRTKVIRKSVTVPEWLAKHAEKAKINFSEVLTEGLRQRLHL